MDFTSPFYIVIVAGVIVVSTGYLLYTLLKKHRIAPAKRPQPSKAQAAAVTTPQAPQNPIDRFVEVEARVYDNETRTVYNATIAADIVRQIRKEYRNLGRTWIRDGKKVYALNKRENGTYAPVIPTETMEQPPSMAHEAITQPEVDVVFDVSQERNFLQKYGHILLFTGAVIFIMFLLTANVMSG